MGAGGATWDTAGALTLDADNTFAVAGSGDEPPFYDLAWWTFTSASPGLLTLTPEEFHPTRLYTGTDAARVELDNYSTEGDYGKQYVLREGVEYHVLGYRLSADPAPASGSYQYTARLDGWSASPWNDSLQDDPDNVIIVTDGEARLLNPNEDYAEIPASRPDWMNRVVRTSSGRTGFYTATEVLGGESAISAVGCCLSHAAVGDVDGQSWNTSTEGPDNDGPGVCRVLPDAGTSASPGVPLDETHFSSGYDPPVGLVAGQASAEVGGPAYTCWFLPVRDSLGPLGALPDAPAPADYGYPDDAVIQYEGDEPDLLGIDVADGDPGTSTAHTNLWALNDGVGPTYDPDDMVWKIGGILGGSVRYVVWEHATGDVVWYEVPDTAGWDPAWAEDWDQAEPATADSVGIALPGDLVESTESARLARLALRFRLQAQRFRFVYPGGTPAPRRVYPSDVVGGGRARVYPRGRAQIGSNRTAGSYL